MWEQMKKENGALIVEASIVFPVMFLVIFFLMFAGNAYLQKCRVEAIITEEVLAGAAYCADPMLDDIESGQIPGFGDVDIQPYRYINLMSGMSDITAEIQENIEKRIAKLDSGLFANMKPDSVLVMEPDFNNFIICSSFSVDATYKIQIPIRLLGQSEYLSLDVMTRTDVPVTDVPEFIRNVDMIEDYVSRFTGEEFDEYLPKLVEHAKEWFD